MSARVLADGSPLKVSVCMATYDGALYVHEQLVSVIAQLEPQDEIVIVDDCSTDSTVAVIESFADPRIRLHRNGVNRGFVATFENAIRLATGDVILLCDQDDRWVEDRVARLVKALRDSRALVVASNQALMDSAGEPISGGIALLRACDSAKPVRNILRIFAGSTSYYGCAMAFRRELTKLILPLPGFIESHDLWIALAANLMGSMTHLEQPTVIRRIHAKNLTSRRRSLYLKLRSRVAYALSIVVVWSRLLGLCGSRGR